MIWKILVKRNGISDDFGQSEFPSKNGFVNEFYKQREFRGLNTRYLKMIQKCFGNEKYYYWKVFVIISEK